MALRLDLTISRAGGAPADLQRTALELMVKAQTKAWDRDAPPTSTGWELVYSEATETCGVVDEVLPDSAAACGRSLYDPCQVCRSPSKHRRSNFNLI